MAKNKNWRFDFFVGIDVSRNELDIALMNRNEFVGHFKIGNTPDEISGFVKASKKEYGLSNANTVYGMEQTGIYCNHLVSFLQKARAQFAVHDALHIRRTLGLLRGKTDKADAIRIAGYLVKNRDELKLWNPKREILHRLAGLASLRNRLVSLQLAITVPLKEGQAFITREAADESLKLCQRTTISMETDIRELDRHIENTWKGDDRLSHLMELVTSVPGVGPVTALSILIATNEFLDISDPRKFACYSGVAPFPHKSGSSVAMKTRVSSVANRHMKKLIHTCAIVACRYVPEISEYYKRKVAEGKPKMSVINAIRFKLITRVFACVNQDRKYIRNYTGSMEQNIQA